jgi:NADH-quinone oxidoreductase subunit F
MAMPVGSMIAKFRDEFEDHIERARAANPFAGEGPAPDLALTQGAVA